MKMRLDIDMLDLTVAPYTLVTLSFPEPDLKDVYALTGVSEPRAWPDDMHDPSKATIGLDIVGSGATDAERDASCLAALAALSDAIHPLAELHYQADGETDVATKLVYSGGFDGGPPKHGAAAITLTLVLYPYWVWSSVAIAPQTHTLSDGSFFPILAVKTKVPALTDLRATCAQASVSITLGLRSSPDTAFSPIRDCGTSSDTSDANAIGGYVKRLAMGATYAPVTGAATLDAVAMLGRYVMWIRGKNGAVTAASTKYRVVSSVTPPIGTPATYSGPDTTSLLAGAFGCLPLGEVSVPASDTPGGDTPSGYSPETLEVNQTTGTATCDVTQASSQVQTFKAVHTGQLTCVALNMGISNSIGDDNVLIKRGGILIASAEIHDYSTAWHDYRFTVPPLVVAGETLSIEVTRRSHPGGYLRLQKSSASVYADGALASGGDLQFKTYEKAWQTFGATVAVEAKCSESGKNFDLDATGLIPCDECYISATAAFAAGQGIDIAEMGMTPTAANVYLADADGNVGASLLGSVDARNPFLLRSGDNIIVPWAYPPNNATPTTMTLWGSYRPRTLAPTLGGV